MDIGYMLTLQISEYITHISTVKSRWTVVIYIYSSPPPQTHCYKITPTKGHTSNRIRFVKCYLNVPLMKGHPLIRPDLRFSPELSLTYFLFIYLQTFCQVRLWPHSLFIFLQTFTQDRLWPHEFCIL